MGSLKGLGRNRPLSFRSSPRIWTGGSILSESFSATKKLSVNRNKNNFYWKALSMLPRKLNELHRVGEERFFQNLNKSKSNIEFYYNNLFTAPSNFVVLKSVARMCSNKAWQTIRKFFFFNQWILLYKLEKQNKLSTSFFRYKRITPPKDRFWGRSICHRKTRQIFHFH